MADDQTLIASIPHSGRSNKGPSRLRRLSLRRASAEKTPFNIDVNTIVASGPNAETFNNYLGVVVRERPSILNNSWDDVSEVDRNMFWEDVLVSFTLILSLSYIDF